MEATHLTAWLGDAETVPIVDDASITIVREHVRELGAELGVTQNVTETVAIAATFLLSCVHAVLVNAPLKPDCETVTLRALPRPVA